jgi:hypothetical protein
MKDLGVKIIGFVIAMVILVPLMTGLLYMMSTNTGAGDLVELLPERESEREREDREYRELREHERARERARIRFEVEKETRGR